MPAQPSATEEVHYSEEDLLDPELAVSALHDSIVRYDNKNVSLTISYLRKVSYDLNKRLDEDTPPVLITAIHFENQYAVEQLVKSGLVDVRIEYLGMNAINRAAFQGNLPILNIIYSRDSNVNDICFDTPLVKSITGVKSYSLMHDSDWGTDENKRKMLSWYEGVGSLLGELSISEKYDASQVTVFNITWKGGLGMAKYLLERGANPKVAIEDKDAEFIVNNLSSKNCLSLFRDCDKTLKFLSEKNGILSFYATLKDRKKTKKIRVIVNFDPREIRALINEYAKKIVDKHSPQQPNFKEWDERFKSVKHTAENAAAMATAANSTAANAHLHLQSLSSKVEVLSVVTQNNAVVLAHTVTRVDKTETDIKTLIEDYSSLKEAANIARELAIIKANKVQNSFYENIYKKIDDFIMSCKQLNGGMVQNQGYSIAHKIAAGIELVGGKIPIVGIASGLLSKAISKGADIYEGRKWERVYHLAPADHAAFSKELAIATTKAYRDELNHISSANTVKPELAIGQALKLATKAADIIIDSMGDTKVDKTKGVPQGVVASQLQSLQANKKFADKLAKYAPPDIKEKRELSVKTHSPGKVTGMVPVTVIPSKPLPAPAVTAKPTPPTVPPRPVTFSGGVAAKANPAFMAQINAAVGAKKMPQVQTA